MLDGDVQARSNGTARLPFIGYPGRAVTEQDAVVVTITFDSGIR
jgi:hypothetical protein